MSTQLIKAVLIKHDEEDDRLEQLNEETRLYEVEKDDHDLPNSHVYLS